ncbi:MAG: CpaF family protein [Eubacteriales bacterium]
MTLLQKRLEQQRMQHQQDDLNQNQNQARGTPSKRILWRQAKHKCLQAAVESFDTKIIEQMPEEEKSQYISRQVETIVEQVLAEMDFTLSRGEYRRIVGEVVSEIIGYGPITPLLDDKTVDEVMVNGPNQVYVERRGKLEITDVVFRDDNHVLHIIEKIIAPLGKRIDESSPLVDARLPDGSRVNATIPPATLNGPVLTIRKFSSKPFTISDLVRFGTLSTSMATFVKACVEGKINIIVGGGTGCGKTSTLNVLSAFIPSSERIITIEDAAELHMQQEHVIRMESRPPNIEGRGQITIRDLVINSLRMRPDRIVVGEVRGGEALDMLQAMNTGHDGSLTTGHANTPRDLLSRIETMVLMAGVDLPIRAIREQIASAINLIVFQSRFKDGTRKITKITEVVGMEGDIITLQDIFVFEQSGVAENGTVLGSYRATGVMPRCLPELEAKGIHVPVGIFS